MSDIGDRKTRELIRGDVFASEPPTTITSMADLRAVLKGEVWTLTILTGDQSGLVTELDETTIVIGRGADAHIRQNDDSLSRAHAAFALEAGVATVADLGSTNGTFVNGRRIVEACVLDSGAHVQLGAKTTVRVQLLHRIELASARALYESSMRDQLTGVYNRRHLDERLENEMAFALRHRTPVSVLMVDIDHFKRINDTWGHLAGDAALERFGALLTSSVREEDIVGRYGGEEFTIILREEDAAGASIVAERIRATVEAERLEWGGELIEYTASIGVACHDTGTPRASAAELVAAADQCLYRAKRAGRNIVISDVSSRSVPPRP